MKLSALTATLLILALLQPVTALCQQVNICDDEAEWPPYTYFQRDDSGADSSKATGAVVDLLDEIFAMIGMKYSLTFLPWKRCTEEVKHFADLKKSEVFINGSFSRKRTEDYYLTTPIYETREVVFYSEKKYPAGPPITRPADVNNFHLCSVHGYNLENLYNNYELAEDKKIDTSARSLFAALKKVSIGHCDLLLNSLEPVYSAPAIGQYTIPKDINFITVPGIQPVTFHIFIAKTSPRAYELLTKINQAILILQHNGRSDPIFAQYFLEK